jgi:phosphoribosylformimino-5-aminoimidazole carboxamide ribotide isomerase
MIIYPAMDLMGGRCVRLAQGRFEEATVYPADPAEALARFAAAGAAWAHVVDLDGARAGAPVQHGLIARLSGAAPLRLQVAGGFRTPGQVAAMLEAGVGRVVIGSLALKAPDLVRRLIVDHGGERIALALDVRLVEGAPRVASAGWTETSAAGLYDVAAAFPGARHLLVTDIGRDGMMHGPNLALYAEMRERLPGLEVQASGGVSSLADLRALAALGLAGAVVGKALWEGAIGLREAIDLAGR